MVGEFVLAVIWADLSNHALPVPKDDGKREPIFNVPAIILVLIALCGLIYYSERHLSLEHLNTIFDTFGFVPARFIYQAWPQGFVALSHALLPPDDARKTVVLAHMLFGSHTKFWTLLTYAFFHGSWLHVGLNMLWLFAFGTPLARRFGSVRFVMLFCLSAIAGSLFHALCVPTQIGTMIGASASVCAMMGGVARFMGYSPILGEAIAQGPMPTIQRALQNRTVRSFILIWFLGNLIFGLMGDFMSGTDTPIAWQAHIGGFLFGFFCLSWFEPRTRQSKLADVRQD